MQYFINNSLNYGLYFIVYQGCGNSKIFYFSRGKLKAKMYLSIENFTCPKNKLAYTLQCLNKLFFQKHYETRYISSLVNSRDPDQLASLENSLEEAS